MRLNQPIRAQLATIASIVVADVLIRVVDLPNPAVVMLLGVVAAAFLDGVRGGLTGTALGSGTALLWFWPVTQPAQEWRVGTILVSGVLMSLLVGELRRRSELSLRRHVEVEQQNRHAVERERYIDELQRSEERNRAFFELAGAGFAEVDAATGRFIRVNDKLAELTGYTPAELLTKTFIELTHPDDRAIAAKQYEDGKRSGRSYDAEKRYLCKNGELRWVHTSIRVVRDASGTPLFSAGIIIDVSEAREAQQALLDANAKLRRLVDSNIAGVIISKPDGSIDEANDAYLAIIGYTREDLISRRVSWREITPPEYFPMEERAVAEANERGACMPYEKEYIRKDGTRVPVLIGFATLPPSSEQYIAFVIDLTQQKTAEARERAARTEAERANRSKDEFLAVVSHELRTPMTSILGWATMLEGSGLDADTRAQGIRLLVESARLETRLIDDLLDFSRAASGKLAIASEDVDLTLLVAQATANAHAEADGRGVALLAHTPDRRMIVRGDEQRLHQVLWNLLANALKFTPAGGSVDVILESDTNEARLIVRDTGRGIRPEFLPHVFDWFTQEDTSTTREAGGLGLGLAIVRHIVGIHGGRIEAHSDGANRGAEFVVTLPLAPERPEIEELASAMLAPPK